MGIFGDIGHFIMTPLYYVISRRAGRFPPGLQRDRAATPRVGAAWALSIIGLTLVIRAALIPLFVKQIKSSRNMQLIQPKVKELQKKYGHDREKLAQETMKLYKETGHQPVRLVPADPPADADLPRAVPAARPRRQEADRQRRPDQTAGEALRRGEAVRRRPDLRHLPNSDGAPRVQILAAVLVVAMTATTFTTQRQLMSKNMPADALSGPYAQQQKMLLYVLPVVFAVGGIAFPIGVLLYWTTSNLWTMGQQFYVIRNNPAPGTPAAKAKAERDADKASARAAGQAAGGRRRRPRRTEQPESQPVPGRDRRPQQRQQPEATVPRAAQEVRRSDAPDGQDRAPMTSDERQAPEPTSEPTETTTQEPGRRGRRSEVETPAAGRPPSAVRQLEQEGDIAADYLEELLDIADLDGDLDMDVEGDRATVSIVGADLPQLVGRDGEVLEALQELTRLAVYRETGERSRLMLDIVRLPRPKRDGAGGAGRADDRPG